MGIFLKIDLGVILSAPPIRGPTKSPDNRERGKCLSYICGVPIIAFITLTLQFTCNGYVNLAYQHLSASGEDTPKDNWTQKVVERPKHNIEMQVPESSITNTGLRPVRSMPARLRGF